MFPIIVFVTGDIVLSASVGDGKTTRLLLLDDTGPLVKIGLMDRLFGSHDSFLLKTNTNSTNRAIRTIRTKKLVAGEIIA